MADLETSRGDPLQRPCVSFWCWVSDPIGWRLYLATFASFFLCYFVLPNYFPEAATFFAPFPPAIGLIAFFPSRLIVGSDGLQWRRLLYPRHPVFVSFGEVALTSGLSNGFLLNLKNGSRIPIKAVGGRKLQEALDSRSTAWRAHIAEGHEKPMGETGAPYRSRSSQEELLALATSPRAAPEARVEALRSLAPIADDRVCRILAAELRRTASPSVRQALGEFARVEVTST